MNAMRVFVCGSLALLALLAGLGHDSRSWAQKPPAPVLPNPQAPVLALTAPAGMQRGTTLELTLTGTNLADPTGVSTSFPAKVTIPQDNKNGRENAKLRVRLEVPADAPLGFHVLRLATRRGMSNLRIFCIDDLPQVVKKDTNRDKATPQAVPVPCVVAGRIDATASDYYKVHVKAGERVTFEILGRRLGSALDPQISLYDATGTREIAYDNDAPGCQTDPRLTHTFKEAGDYLVEVKDVLNRGGADFCYRLRIGDFPCATVPIPMAAKRGSKVSVSFAGPVVAGVAPVMVDVPTDPLMNVVSVAPRGPNGLYGWPVDLAISDFPELLEKEPNDEPARANRVPVPGGITGRFEKSNELDYFVFSAKKTEKLLIEAHTLEHNSPTLVYLVIKDAKGKSELARSNPQLAPPADQRIEFTPPADGDYLVEVQHLNYQGGPSEAYRLTVTPNAPAFDLSLAIERYDAAPGASASLPILVTRRGYNGPIEVRVVAGHPGISGQATIPAGKPAKANEPGGVLQLQVKTDVPPGPYTFTLQGSATIAGKQVTAYVDVRAVVSQNLANLPYPPRFLFHQLALAVKDKPAPKVVTRPFEFKVDSAPFKLKQGTKAILKISVVRKGYVGPIAVEVKNLPVQVTAAKGTIPEGQNAVDLVVTAAAAAPVVSNIDVTVVGTATALANRQIVSPNFTVRVEKQ